MQTPKLLTVSLIGSVTLLSACVGVTPEQIKASNQRSYDNGYSVGYAEGTKYYYPVRHRNALLSSENGALRSALDEQQSELAVVKSAMRRFAADHPCVNFIDDGQGFVGFQTIGSNGIC